MSRRRTNIELDDEIVEAAMRLYGTRSKKETVDLAVLVDTSAWVAFLRGTGSAHNRCIARPARRDSRSAPAWTA
jgi:hypothetical protein